MSADRLSQEAMGLVDPGSPFGFQQSGDGWEGDPEVQEGIELGPRGREVAFKRGLGLRVVADQCEVAEGTARMVPGPIKGPTSPASDGGRTWPISSVQSRL